MKKHSWGILTGLTVLVVTAAIASAAGLPGYMLTASPSAEGIFPLQTAHYNVTVSAFNGFAGGVALSCRSNSPHIQCAVSPRLVIFHQDSPVMGVPTQKATLLATTDNGTPPGTYQIEIFGNAAEMSSSTTVELVVFNI
jgi:hypothetical protein